MKKIIVAFGHQKETGKDSIIKFCIDVLRPKLRAKRIVRRGFADKVYDICHMLYGWAGFQPRSYYAEHPYAKKNMLDNGKTVREVLIDIGQHLRKYDNDVWINCALRTDDSDVLFISDLRFPTEFLHCEAVGATLIRITRPGLETPTDEADTALNGWEDRWTDIVENNDGLHKLHAEAERIVDRYVLARL
jgi:hypothetical protein